MASIASQPVSVSVIGLGAWGSALAAHCARKGHRVTGWHRDATFAQAANSSRRWRLGSEERELPPNLTITSQLSDCASAEVTIIALPASAWSSVLPKLQISLLVSATKGLERDSGLTPLSYAEKTLGMAPSKLCVISGPSFASDLIRGTPVSVVAASHDADTASRVARLLSDTSLRVYTSTDTMGVELGGILKNIIAIAVGISDALGYGPSTRAALISRGLAEMTRIASGLGANPQTLAGLSGLGDLVMTATDDQSRNRQVGLRLGRGEKLGEIIASLGSTAEGVASAPLVEKLAKQSHADTPIIHHVVEVLRGAIAPKDLATALMSRPLKSEF